MFSMFGKLYRRERPAVVVEEVYSSKLVEEIEVLGVQFAEALELSREKHLPVTDAALMLAGVR